MDENLIYPIKFEPILQEKIWGGKKLVTEFHKKSKSKSNKIGESWELSGVDNFVSIVANGSLKGLSITDVINKFEEGFLGKKVFNEFGANFPLLFKFIDASENLSIQLHPNDTLAKERHNSFGKTEMWYVLDANKDSKLYAGFNKQLNKETYLEVFNSGKLLDVIHEDKVEAGDAFFIEVGTIHAIGKDIVIAEIQQTSDITYRVYDWDRVDSAGQGRTLHTELALDAFDFSKVGTCKVNYRDELNTPNKIISCQYFTTNKLNLTKDFIKDLSKIDSFIVYMCVEGAAIISLNNHKEKITKGETILIPALAEELAFLVEDNVSLLEVCIN